jgi:DNA phosphorothioation-associated putative methyltransferase
MRDEERSIGKVVRGALYLHRDAIGCLAENERTALVAAERLAGPASWNVAKLELSRRARIGLLLYEDFASTPFPALLESGTVDLRRGSVTRRNLRASDNPPILHRKELLLAPDDPRRPVFARLTADLEARGLFRDAHRIGRRRAWDERLAAAGVRIEDHRVVEVERKG